VCSNWLAPAAASLPDCQNSWSFQHPKHHAAIVSDGDFSSIEKELFFGDYEQFGGTLNLCLKDTPVLAQTA
jgi:hypothetical protein